LSPGTNERRSKTNNGGTEKGGRFKVGQEKLERGKGNVAITREKRDDR